MPKILAACLTLVLIWIAAPVEARHFSPRVSSPHVADTYNMQTFAQFPRWHELKGDAKALEVFKYLADEQTGLFPLGMPVVEGDDVLSEFTQVRDPVKLINVYGYGYCGILGPTMAGACEQMGIGPARTLVLPGWHHVVGETWYDGRWHYLDLDVRAAFRRADGRLASMAEAQTDDSLWRRSNGPLFFPLDPLDRVREVYRSTPVHCYYGHHYSGHTMDYVLRQGETLTRWWRPQGGRWHHSAAYHEDDFFRKLFEREPRGPKCKHTDWTVHTHGNGRFVYRPDLTNRSSDFEDGVYDGENVVTSAEGLTLQRPGRGFAVFEVRSPYVIVPLVGKMETTEDDRDAAIVKLNARGAEVSISLDNGLTWQDVRRTAHEEADAAAEAAAAEAAAAEFDLTQHVSGRYSYLLRVSLEGQPGEAVLRRMEISTWVQVASASLPSLRQGENRMEFRVGDHHGLSTRVMEIRTNGSNREDFLKHVDEPPADFDPGRKDQRAKGTFIVKLQAPPRSKIAWFSAGGNFNTYQGEAARNTRNSMAYAVDEPTDFAPFYEANVPADQAHWHYNADREVKLDEPARIAYLRYVGDPGVNTLRIYAHCIDEHVPTSSPVTITHAWKEGDELKSDRVTLERPGTYSITTQAEPTNEYVEFSVPTCKKR